MSQDTTSWDCKIGMGGVTVQRPGAYVIKEAEVVDIRESDEATEMNEKVLYLTVGIRMKKGGGQELYVSKAERIGVSANKSEAGPPDADADKPSGIKKKKKRLSRNVGKDILQYLDLSNTDKKLAKIEKIKEGGDANAIKALTGRKIILVSRGGNRIDIDEAQIRGMSRFIDFILEDEDTVMQDDQIIEISMRMIEDIHLDIFVKFCENMHAWTAPVYVEYEYGKDRSEERKKKFNAPEIFIDGRYGEKKKIVCQDPKKKTLGIREDRPIPSDLWDRLPWFVNEIKHMDKNDIMFLLMAAHKIQCDELENLCCGVIAMFARNSTPAEFRDAVCFEDDFTADQKDKLKGHSMYPTQ